MSYKARLLLWRVIFFGFLLLVWLFYISQMGFQPGWMDVTGLLLLVGYLGRPRNAAKIYAKRALRRASLNAAVQEEIRRRSQ